MPDQAQDARAAVRNDLSRAVQTVVDAAGAGITAVVAVLLMLGWIVVGIFLHFHEPWLTVLHSVTIPVTFAMVFFIQHTTDRQLRAVLLKLDELVRVEPTADNEVIRAERGPLDRQERLEQPTP